MFSPGEYASNWYLLLAGEVQLFLPNQRNGKPLLLKTIHAGCLFGELDVAHHTCSAVVSRPAEFIKITQSHFISVYNVSFGQKNVEKGGFQKHADHLQPFIVIMEDVQRAVTEQQGQQRVCLCFSIFLFLYLSNSLPLYLSVSLCISVSPSLGLSVSMSSAAMTLPFDQCSGRLFRTRTISAPVGGEFNQPLHCAQTGGVLPGNGGDDETYPIAVSSDIHEGFFFLGCLSCQNFDLLRISNLVFFSALAQQFAEKPGNGYSKISRTNGFPTPSQPAADYHGKQRINSGIGI